VKIENIKFILLRDLMSDIIISHFHSTSRKQKMCWCVLIGQNYPITMVLFTSNKNGMDFLSEFLVFVEKYEYNLVGGL